MGVGDDRSASGGGGGGGGGGPTPDADGGGLFLDDLLAGVGVHAPPYPFKSATEAAERVFRHGSAAPAALVAKQSLFLYYLLDAGLPPDGAPARFASHVRLHPRLFVETRCAALLDDHGNSASLELACALLPGASHPGLPLGFVATLARRGENRRTRSPSPGRGGATSPRGLRVFRTRREPTDRAASGMDGARYSPAGRRAAGVTAIAVTAMAVTAA